MKVELIKNPSLWDRFVESRPDSVNQHRWAWRLAIQDTYGHTPHYLAALEGDRIDGVLPLFHIRSRIFGTSLVSVPFFSYGGVLAASPAARASLLNAAIELGRSLRVQRIELRQGEPADPGWTETASKVTMDIPLAGTTDEMWKRLTTGLRNKIRNGQKQNYRVEWGGVETVDAFYPIFAANMRNLGTPVYPKSWFQNLVRCSPESVKVLVLRDGEIPVAGAFLTAYRKRLELPWSASLPEWRKKYSHVALYWTFLQWAIENGFEWMDVGRCNPGGGTYEFKRHWGCRERMLQWNHWSPGGGGTPAPTPESSKFRLAVNVWKRLPLPVANSLGPMIVRSIP